MVNTTVNNEARPIFFEEIRDLLFKLSVVFLFIVGLTIFQDFLESKRSGYNFYFNESLLFKTIWFLFIPILVVLQHKLKNETLGSYGKMAIYSVLPVVAHFFILPFVAMIFSMFFYEGRYDLYKFFSYTLTHDLYKLVIVYAGYVLGYKCFLNHTRDNVISESRPAVDTIIVNNGKNNVIINVEDIIQITSARPYIFIHLQNKKYLHSETLKSICKQLNNNVFVRVHKSTAINITKVMSFKSRLNGDYDLMLTNGESTRLSRTYAADFKKCFDIR